MPAQLLDGKQLAATRRQVIRQNIERYRQGGQRIPGLTVILVGENPASAVYVEHKKNACNEVGILSHVHRLDGNVTQEELLALIHTLNHDQTVDGILVQLPLPKHINESEIVSHIAVHKDVDGFHPENVGWLMLRQPQLRPCTPQGIMDLLALTGRQLRGMDAVIIGASNIVGRPMALELLLAGATVTVCHRFTQDIKKHVERADLVISAVGKPHLIKGAWIKPDAIVVDVGITRLANGQLTGDIEFEVAAQRAGWITPVPGGVGPMTVVKILENTLIYNYSRK